MLRANSSAVSSKAGARRAPAGITRVEYPVHSRPIRPLNAGTAPVRSMLLLLGAAWLAGCTPAVTVTSAWQDSVPRNQSFKRVLVVGVSPDVRQRCPFERFLAFELESESTKAIASCDAVTQKDPLTRESIDLAIASQKADAVLATLLVSKKWDVEEGGDRDTRGGAYYKATDSGYATGYYGTYGVPVVYGEFQTASAITTMKGEVRITSKLYETRGATLVYTLDTLARDIESRDAGLGAITAPIAERLRKDGLIR